MMLPERPPAERITEILKTRREIAAKIRGYHTRRDFLQLCAELDHCRKTVLPPENPVQGGPEIAS